MRLGGIQAALLQVEKSARLNPPIPNAMAPCRPVFRSTGLLRADVCHNSTGPPRVFEQLRRIAARAPWNHPGSIIPPPNYLPTITHDRVGTRIAIKRVCFQARQLVGVRRCGSPAQLCVWRNA